MKFYQMLEIVGNLRTKVLIYLCIVYNRVGPRAVSEQTSSCAIFLCITNCLELETVAYDLCSILRKELPVMLQQSGFEQLMQQKYGYISGKNCQENNVKCKNQSHPSSFSFCFVV